MRFSFLNVGAIGIFHDTDMATSLSAMHGRDLRGFECTWLQLDEATCIQGVSLPYVNQITKRPKVFATQEKTQPVSPLLNSSVSALS